MTLAQAQEIDVEPNSLCVAAQSLPSPTDGSPLVVTGSLDVPPTTPDVDFYRLSLAPGTLLQIRLQGQSSGQGTLFDPYLGAYADDCFTFLDVNNDNFEYTESGEPDLDSFLELTVPASGVVVLAAASVYDYTFKGNGAYSGTYRLSVEARDLRPARSVSGRVVDAATGSPVQKAYVVLYHCSDILCTYRDVAAWGDTGVQGEFRFENGAPNTHSLFLPGFYLVTVPRATYERGHRGPFTLSSEQELDVGAIGLRPLLPTGSIHGRLVDGLTGEPLSGRTEPFAVIEVLRCGAEPDCQSIRYVRPDQDGTFLIQEDPAERLFPGTYRLRANARQYQTTLSEPIQVRGLENLEIGDLAVKSFPVRLYIEQPCGPIPMDGGECRFQMRVVNSSSSQLAGEAWSTVSGSPINDDMESSTSFQAGPARAVNLGPGASAVVPFSMFLPAELSIRTVICAMGYVARRPHSFNTLARDSLFCFIKGDQGFALVVEEQESEAVRRLNGER